MTSEVNPLLVRRVEYSSGIQRIQRLRRTYLEILDERLHFGMVTVQGDEELVQHYLTLNLKVGWSTPRTLCYVAMESLIMELDAVSLKLRNYALYDLTYNQSSLNSFDLKLLEES